MTDCCIEGVCMSVNCGSHFISIVVQHRSDESNDVGEISDVQHSAFKCVVGD